MSSILDLARDYSRFVITFFDLISVSASHIYLSALPLSPQTSLVREMYKRHQCPLVRVVQGLPTSWEAVVTSIYNEDFDGMASWSPCNRFIAVARSGTVEIRDAVTLSLLNTFESPSDSDPQFRFSQDSRFLTRFSGADLVTWDLQTGGLVGVDTVLPQGMDLDWWYFSSTYSTDGKMLAVVYSDEDLENPNTFIATHDFSTTPAHLYRVPEGHFVSPIWTHGEFLRFATVELGHMTIWELDFILTQIPQVVESLPVPDETADTGGLEESLFLPTLSRLAMAFEYELLVWDARDSKILLKTRDIYPPRMTFSSNGRFFACAGHDRVHVWKESPAGYVLHQKLAFSPDTGPFLSPNGESIVASLSSTIHLWHTKDPILFGGPIPTSGKSDFFLEFSQHQAFAAFARFGATTVAILDLQSGDLQLEINMAEEVDCLGITESSIVAVSGYDISTWDPNATADTRGGVQTAKLSPSRGHRSYPHMSVSPDLSRIATVERRFDSEFVSLEIYDVFTGRCLASAALGTGVSKSPPTPDEFKTADTGSRFRFSE